MPQKTTLSLILFMVIVISACQATPSSLSTMTPTMLIASPTNIPTQPISTPDLSAYLTRVAQIDQNRINELITTNAGCNLPCWWGITPGLTTLSETDRLMRELGAFGSALRNQGVRLPDGSALHEVGFDLANPRESISIQFGEKNDIVQSLHIDISAFAGNQEDALDFRYWDNYSLNQIFEKYGKPDRVWLKNTPFVIEPPPSDMALYGLFVFYDNLKFLLIYSGIAKIEDPIFICPNFDENGQVGDMNIHLVSPSKEIALEEYAGFKLDRQEESMLPIEEATGFSVSEFYSLFLSGTRCFETPLKIWH